MTHPFTALPAGAVTLTPGTFARRRDAGRAYLVSLSNDNLIRHHRHEAGLWYSIGEDKDIHGGWENPACEVRGHFFGHWLSAAAELAAATDDDELRGRVRFLVKELARCQQANGGEWIAPIPEKALHQLGSGTPRWAPVYVVHKTLQGLADTAKLLEDDLAWDVLGRAAAWFTRWTDGLSAEQRRAMLVYESGCITNVWADLYEHTGDAAHWELFERFYRQDLFAALGAGRDVLSNRHANTTIPEAIGAARAYEVSGDTSYRAAVEAYWDCAVNQREAFVTGGQTCVEMWAPAGTLANRLGEHNQEHCTVFNLMELAEYLLRWTGDPKYAAYRELNLVNGVLAQQHPTSSVTAYYLPMVPGGVKKWVTPTQSFPCCQGTTVQAASRHHRGLFYATADGLAIAYPAPSVARFSRAGAEVTVRVETVDSQAQHPYGLDQELLGGRPDHDLTTISVQASRPVEFTLSVRVPDWADGPARLRVNGEAGRVAGPGFADVRRTWHDDTVQVQVPRTLTCHPVAGRDELVGFRDGPLALAGLCADQPTLVGDRADPAGFIDRIGEWHTYRQDRYAVRGQAQGLTLAPVRDIVDEPFTLYFPLRWP